MPSSPSSSTRSRCRRAQLVLTQPGAGLDRTWLAAASASAASASHVKTGKVSHRQAYDASSRRTGRGACLAMPPRSPPDPASLSRSPDPGRRSDRGSTHDSVFPLGLQLLTSPSPRPSTRPRLTRILDEIHRQHGPTRADLRPLGAPTNSESPAADQTTVTVGLRAAATGSQPGSGRHRPALRVSVTWGPPRSSPI